MENILNHPLLILIVAGIAVAFLVLFTVAEKKAYVIERLGKFHQIAHAGLNFKIPLIDQIAGKLNLKINQLDVHVETKTNDNVFLNIQVSVQFCVMSNKVKEAFYSLENPSKQISSHVFDDVRSEVPKLDLDDVFSKKEDIAYAVKNNISAIMQSYGYEIVKVLITDINPDEKVKISMNRINSAKRDKEAAWEEAEANKITIVKKAEADAESMRLQGEGIANQRQEMIKGFKNSIEDFQKSINGLNSEDVMQFVLITQYFDMLKEVGGHGKNTTLLIPHSPSAIKDIQQQILEGTILSKKVE